MNYHVLTLFPDMVVQGLSSSIIGRALRQEIISLETVNIRDFAENKHNRVDDYTYGGGAGMLMQAQPVYDAWKYVKEKLSGKTVRTIYVTPQGALFTQEMARQFSQSDDLIFICGHYEGIDERVLAEVVTDYVSVGDYVLTGGELPAMIMIDAVSRFVRGVLHNDESAERESFYGDLLEYPQYSRPKIWHGKEVPDVLLSGNAREIEKWRLEQAVKRTEERRPDLFEKYRKMQQIQEFLQKRKLLHMDMLACIGRGDCRLAYQSGDGQEILLADRRTGIFLHTNPRAGDSVPDGDSVSFLSDIPDKTLQELDLVILHQKELSAAAKKRLGAETIGVCYPAVYTRKEKLSVSGLYHMDGTPAETGIVIRRLEESHIKTVAREYLCSRLDCRNGGDCGIAPLEAWKRMRGETDDEAYIRERIMAGEMFGAFFGGEDAEQKPVGFIGTHWDGSMGFLTVSEEYRRGKIAMALETYLINRQIERGIPPFGLIFEENEQALALQKKLGLYLSKTPIVWMMKKV